MEKGDDKNDVDMMFFGFMGFITYKASGIALLENVVLVLRVVSK